MSIRPTDSQIRLAYQQLINSGFSSDAVKKTKAELVTAALQYAKDVPEMAPQAKILAEYGGYSIKSLRKMKVKAESGGSVKLSTLMLAKGEVKRMPDGRFTTVAGSELVSANKTFNHKPDVHQLGLECPNLTIEELRQAFGGVSVKKIASMSQLERQPILNAIKAAHVQTAAEAGQMTVREATAPTTSLVSSAAVELPMRVVAENVANAKLSRQDDGSFVLRLYADPKGIAGYLNLPQGASATISSIGVFEPPQSGIGAWTYKAQTPARMPATPHGWSQDDIKLAANDAFARDGIGVVAMVSMKDNGKESVQPLALTTPGRNIFPS